nr:putative sodium-dependent multivitamin transporter [Dermacentor andersoni]
MTDRVRGNEPAAGSLHPVDIAVFCILTAAGYIVGLYFSFKGRRSQVPAGDLSGTSAVLDAFLGGRSLPAAALAVSVLASVASSASVVSFIGHYYAYGFHVEWTLTAIPLAAATCSFVLVPLLYDLQVASVFQYLRMRFDKTVGITACVVYFILSEQFILLWVTLDLTSDENVWSGLAGAVPFSLVRTGFDQMAVQRFMAARTLRDAKRIAVAGPLFVLLFFFVADCAGIAIIYWFRDCDPLLRGAIKSYDQIIPHYMMTNLANVPVLRGLFLAGLVGASTSTVSSIVNSHAAICYIDVVTPYVKISEQKAGLVMRLLGMSTDLWI